MFKHPTYY